MSDLGTHRVYTTNFQGNPAGIALNDSQVKQVKHHAQQNTAGALAQKIAPNKQEGPFDIFQKWLLGFTIPGFLGKFLRDDKLNNSNFKQTKFAKILDRVDDFSEKRLKWAGNAWERVKASPVATPFKHFAKHSRDVRPVWDSARSQTTSFAEESVEELINKAKSIYEGKGGQRHRSVLNRLDNHGLKNPGFIRSGFRSFVNTINVFGIGIKKRGYQAAADSVIPEMKKLHDASVLKELTKHTQDRLTKSLEKYEKAVGKHTKNSRQAAKAARGVLENAAKVTGELKANKFRILLTSYKRGGLTPKEAYKELHKILKKAPVGLSEEFHIQKNMVKLAKGVTKTNANRSFLSRALAGMQKGGSKVLRFDPLIGAFFIGDVIKKTFDAKWGDKLSTFAEGMAGEVLPYWVLINATANLPYQAAGGLKTFGKSMPAAAKDAGLLKRTFSYPFRLAKHIIQSPIKGIGHVLTSPIRGLGNVLKFRTEGKLTYKMADTMSEEQITKLFQGNKAATKEFYDCVKKIKSGTAGPKNWLNRVMTEGVRPWHKEFYKFKGNASPTWQKMNNIFKNNVGWFGRTGKIGLLRRTGIRCLNFAGGAGRFVLIGFAIMPLVGSILTKVSHKIFGKPQATIDEENAEKAAEKAAETQQTE